MAQFLIHGTVQPAARRFASCQAVAVTRSRTLLPGSTRESGGEFAVRDDEVARVELKNGLVLWTRTDDLLREWGRPIAGPDGGQAWEIDPQPCLRSGLRSQRGLLGLTIKAIEFLGIDVKERVASVLGAALEAKLLRGNEPGLYGCALSDRFELSALPDAPIPSPGGKPLLIFLHGTASSCEGSFGKLWSGKPSATAARLALADKYGDRVYAWEHRSLTHSPIRNALELARRLPKDADIDLVSHSRGGLVGELLCLAQRGRDPDPFRQELMDALFAADRTIAGQLGLSPLDEAAARARDEAYDADRQLLAELLDELDGKRPRIRRFVRVACPARGTTLASGRLDRWLSVLNHLTGDGLIADGADFLLGVVKERTDPRTLPGLEAMMPGSALTRLLQHPGLSTEADLTVIAGDIEGDGLWGQIKLLAADWFYGNDHDLVVNTGSMVGGLRRPESGARFLRDQGPEVCHFNYFDNDKSVRWLAAGLLRPEGGDGGFLPLAGAPREEPRWRAAVRRSRAAAAPRPLAVVVPGTMGSALKAGGDKVWLDYWSLMWGGLGRIGIDAAAVEPFDLLEDFYGPLLGFLARSHRVEIFPYDWRLSVRDAARTLARQLEEWLPQAERDKQPVHLVAHSMGGLVVRAMIADGGPGAALWRRIQALPNSRLLMLGTPNLGSHEAMRWLTATNPTEAKLSLLDLTRSMDGIVDLVRRFPGLVELLPFADDQAEFGRADTWRRLRQAIAADWPAVEETVLRPARDTWALLRQAPADPDFMIYVAGCQDETVAGYRLEPYREPWLENRRRLAFDATRRGDGTVTWQSGLLPGVPVWYAVDTAHDELCATRRLLYGYLDLLMTGRTTRLADAPPESARSRPGEPELFPLTVLPPTDGIPDAGQAGALGFGPARPAADADGRPVLPAIRVVLRHGDLAFAHHPVMVGHYLGDVVVSAEAALDRRLDGALARRRHLGLYPGLPRSHAVFFHPQPKGRPAGAIVVGLGQVGELSATLLQTTVRDALADYALQVAQWPDERFGEPGSVRSAAVSALLVGTGPGGVAVADSVEAVLRGAVAANARLEQAGMDRQVLIDKIEFLEIFEDTAIAAAQALEHLLADGQLAGHVDWPGRVVEEGHGRRRRVVFGDAPGWWYRLEIIEETSGGLRFIATTHRARAEVTQATGQLHLAEGFIRQASRSPSSNPEVARTLFEMLLPNRLKELAPNQENLVLLVDELSARYPWELLEDRWSQNDCPPAVAAGMVRQFKTRQVRPHPAHTGAATAYVVGNPNLEGWQAFPDLPGARREAVQVAALLRGRGYKVHDCIDESADQVMDGLHRDAWRILHLAGHGEHLMPVELPPANGARHPECAGETSDQPRTACLSGMVIGKGTFLTPGDVEQMRWVPELVFINCCHLGKTQAPGHGDYGLLAANLAVQFIDMGVKAVVAAGWAVDDAAAGAFARSFYIHLLAGQPFGEAVRAAREEVWTRHRDVNTWGAYQCYGDPGFRLAADGSAPTAKPAYHAPAELVAELDNHREWLRLQGGADDTAADRIGGLLAGIPEARRDDWLARADVAAALGFAWGEAGDFDQAIAWLDRALAARDGDCPLRAMEDRARFRIRRIAREWRTLRQGGAPDEAGRATLAEEAEATIGELAVLCWQGPSHRERLVLLSDAYKYLAWLMPGKRQRVKALVQLSNASRAAFEAGGGTDAGLFATWAVADILASRLVPKYAAGRMATLADDCRRMAELAGERYRAQPGCQAAMDAADCELARLLIQGAPGPDDLRRVATIHRKACRGGASPDQIASARDHLDFLLDMTATAQARLHQALQAIRERL